MVLIDKLKSGWTLLKFIRVGLGSLILYSSAQSGHVPGMIAGGLFTILSLFTDGVCFAGGGCAAPAPKKNSITSENIEYEELGHK